MLCVPRWRHPHHCRKEEHGAAQEVAGGIQEAKFKQRIVSGPTEAEGGVCTLAHVVLVLDQAGWHVDYDEIVDAIVMAWNKIVPDRLASITATDWISRMNQTGFI